MLFCFLVVVDYFEYYVCVWGEVLVVVFVVG